MGSQQAFLELLEWLQNSDVVDLASFFEKVQKRYRLTNMVYANKPLVERINNEQPYYFAAARHETLLKGMAAEALQKLVLKECWDNVAPCEIDIKSGLIREFDADVSRLATLAGLGSHAVVFPLFGGASGRTLLSVHSDVSPSSWKAMRPRLIRSLTAPVAYFHARQLVSSADHKTEADTPRLTPRESEVLSWVSVGKSYWEISRILGISERTVRFFMSNIRNKLNAVSNKQALAEAAWHGLLDEHHPGRPRSGISDR